MVWFVGEENQQRRKVGGIPFIVVEAMDGSVIIKYDGIRY